MSYDIEKIIAGIPLERQGRENVKKYFLENPDTIEEVERAYYAYHTIWMDKNAHSFTNSCKDSKCIWCGQTREGVRWNYYGLTPKCTRRPNEADTFVGIEDVLNSEETRFGKLLTKAEEIAKELDPLALTGEQLAIFHHTHGIDPSMLESALMVFDKGKISQELHDVYELEMQKEVDRSRKTQKKTVISVNKGALL
jgi:hypothetical protein